jgi:hypothetical protein
MRTFATVSMVVLAGVMSTGCLQKEVTHTIYISPQSAVWSTIETNVRSDEKVATARAVEEHDYFLAASAGQHPVAQSLRALGAHAVTTTWLRRDRPYGVLTEGRFADLRALATAILREAQLHGDVTLIRDGMRTTFAIRVDVEPASDAGGEEVDALLADLEDYRFVLTEGRFISADGFTIGSDGGVARPDPTTIPEHGTVTLRLVWDETAR